MFTSLWTISQDLFSAGELKKQSRQKIRIETIREAYHKYKSEHRHITLITDGGPENDNRIMCEFIKNETIDFSTAIALQDVPFSNSLVETQNKLFKYHYLYRQEYENGDDLKRDLQRTFMTIILFARIFP